MDGVMFMHHTRLTRMHAILNDHSIIAGTRMVTTAFSFQGDDCILSPKFQTHVAPKLFLGDAKFFHSSDGNIRTKK
jgi:hypothetical protein